MSTWSGKAPDEGCSSPQGSSGRQTHHPETGHWEGLLNSHVGWGVFSEPVTSFKLPYQV